jgi:hypothetical protein
MSDHVTAAPDGTERLIDAISRAGESWFSGARAQNEAGVDAANHVGFGIKFDAEASAFDRQGTNRGVGNRHHEIELRGQAMTRDVRTNVILQHLRNSTVQIRSDRTAAILGTGVVISASGIVATCAHVLRSDGVASVPGAAMRGVPPGMRRSPARTSRRDRLRVLHGQ